ncbi:MAG: dihydrolipoamide acetyltransferase family protein, partial [Bacteroidales bacterium]
DVEPTGPGNRLIKRDILAYAATIKQVKVTPVARQVARSEGIRLNELNGTGPMGRIHKSDVLNAAKRNTISAAAGDEDEVEQFDKVRKIIADRLSLSKQTIPHYYLNIDVEVENALKLKDKLKKEPGVKVSFNDILVQAVARVLRRYKRLNSHVDYEKIVIKKTMNIGIAVSTEAGLFVPVLAHADKKTLAEISKEIRKLADDARRGIVNPANQATFTISNLGMYGISVFQAIINPPECAILSVGAIEKRVIPSENGIKIADMVNIGLAVDHRAVDGAYAAQFLNELKTELTNINI